MAINLNDAMSYHGSGLPSRLHAYLQLTRAPDTAVAFAATTVAASLAHPEGVPLPTVLALAVSNGLVCAASMAFNDWHDVREDAINKPSRPIVSGRVPRGQALAIGCALFPAATLSAAAAGAVLAVGAVAITCLSVAYTLRLKRVPLVGNTVVAFVMSYPLACWMLAGPTPPAFVVLVAGCFAIRLAGELVKTAEDVLGDRASGIPTIATARGVGFAKRAGLISLSVGIGLGALPVVRADAGPFYDGMLLLSGLITLTAWIGTLGLLRVWSPSSSQLVGVERAVTVCMVVGLSLGLRLPRI